MNGSNNNNEETTPPLDMKTRALTWLLMQGLGVVVLVIWVWTLYGTLQKKEEQLAQIVTTLQTQNQESIIVMTQVKQLLEDIKYQTRITDIRNK